MNKIILTDVDEVLLKWGYHFEQWYRNTCGNFGRTEPASELKNAENVEEWLNCDLETTRKLVKQFNQCKDNFPFLTPYDDALEYVNKLHKDYGYTFVAITACDTDRWTHDVRFNNLEKYFPGVFDTVHCTGLSSSKVDYLQRYHPTYWVEDKTRHAEDGGNLGHQSFLITRTYNEKDELTISKRVKSWKEIFNCITNNDCYHYGWMA